MYHIICNHTSGRDKKKIKIINEVKSYLDKEEIEYLWHETEYQGHPSIIAKEIENEYNSGNIIVIGGDGTLNEVLRGIDDPSKFNFGIVPTGSGNDFAQNIGINPKEVTKNIERIVKGNASKIDYIKVNDTKCINIIGTGIDVLVLQKFEKHKKLKGSFRYLVSLIGALITFKWYEFDLSIDDKEFEHKKGFVVALCNGSTFGGGIPICKGAKVDDEKLEFVFVSKMPRIKIIPYLFSLLKGNITKKKEAEHVYCDKVIFKSDQEFVMQIDGNLDKVYSEYVCEIIKGGTNFYK